MPFDHPTALRFRTIVFSAAFTAVVACGSSAPQPDLTETVPSSENLPAAPEPVAVAPSDPIPRVTPVGDSTLYFPKEEFKFRVQVQTSSGSTRGLKVYFRTDGGTPWLGYPTELDGIFEFRTTLYGFERVLTLWAEDSLGNSGRDRGAPYETVITVNVDSGPPLMGRYYETTYRDERYLHLLRDEFGNLLLPPVYQSIYPVNPLTAKNIYKTPARFTWGPTPPTAAELESTNQWNTPFFRFYVSYSPGKEAPLEKVEYCVGSTCRPALPSPNDNTDSHLTFAAPIASETVPEIANLRDGSITLPVKIVATDAAGNRGELSLGDITYNVVPPPVSVKEDPDYEIYSADDPRSASYYRGHPDRVLGLFKAPAIPTLRLKRYEIRNPGTVPVTLVLPKNGESRITHSWLNSNLTPPQSAPGTFLSPDGSSWPSNPTYLSGPFLSCKTPINPCSGSPNTVPVYQAGVLQCQTPSLPPGGTSTSFRLLPLQYEAVTGPFRVYAQETVPVPAQDDGTTYRFKVPAAEDGKPGIVVLYVSRPVPADFGAEFAIQDLGFGRVTVQGWRRDSWKQVSISPCCGGLTICGNFVAERWATELRSSLESLTGELRMETHNAKDDLSVGPTLGPSPYPTPSFVKTLGYY